MPVVSAQLLARTYSHPSVADPYEIVEQYRQAMRYDPDEGSTAIARELDVPRGRVRPWLDGAKPDPVHAIEIADAHGWLADDWTPTVRALARLIGGVYACGSISRDAWRPSWTPETDVVWQQVEADLETLGVDARAETGDRTAELWAADHASVLGRALAAAGAPVGSKTAKTVTGLPDWLADAPPSVRADVAEVLVRERATEYPQKATRRIVGNRAPSYFRQVADLIEDVTGERATWSEAGVTISAAAIRALGLAD